LEVKPHTSLTSALVGGVWSVSHSSCFISNPCYWRLGRPQSQFEHDEEKSLVSMGIETWSFRPYPATYWLSSFCSTIGLLKICFWKCITDL
jgi:hypothetical protein